MEIIPYKLVPFVLSNKWMTEGTHIWEIGVGWGNGYVAVSKSHPLHGIDYDDLYKMGAEIDIHGGLTYSDFYSKSWNIEGLDESYWVFGFDTNHLGDSLENWPNKGAVMTETMRLYKQLFEYKKK